MTMLGVRPPQLDGDVPVDLPPMDVIKCQCELNVCPMSGPCPLDAVTDELLCTVCAELKRHKDNLDSGVFSSGLVDSIIFLRKARATLGHCHSCDPKFKGKGDGHGNRSGQA